VEPGIAQEAVTVEPSSPSDDGIPIRFTVNGRAVSLEVLPGETALHAVRERLGLKGAKEGCGIGECGACTMVVDGKAVNGCLMMAAQLDGRTVLTVEGLESPVGLHPLQEAFLEHHAVQCGFCTPGTLMSAHAFLQACPSPPGNGENATKPRDSGPVWA